MTLHKTSKRYQLIYIGISLICVILINIIAALIFDVESEIGKLLKEIIVYAICLIILIALYKKNKENYIPSKNIELGQKIKTVIMGGVSIIFAPVAVNSLFCITDIIFDTKLTETVSNMNLKSNLPKDLDFSRHTGSQMSKAYVFSLVFALMSRNKGKFLSGFPDHLIQEPCGSPLRFPCGVGVDVHCGIDIGMS